MVETIYSRKGNNLGIRPRALFDLSARGRVLTKTQMSPILLVVRNVVAEKTPKVNFVKDRDMVEQLAEN